MKVLVSDFFGVIVGEMLPPFFRRRVPDAAEAMRIKLSYSDPADIGDCTFMEELALIGKDLGLSKEEILEECLTYSTPIERTISLVRSCQYPRILLSNAPEGLVEMMLNRYNLHDLFEHKIISYQLKCKKPDRRMYEAVYRYYGDKQEYLFMDDNEKNLLVPESMGWETILFDESDECFASLNRWIS